MFASVRVAADLRALTSWNLTVGDVKQTLVPEAVPNYDYLFIDSDHSVAFTKWYLQSVVQPAFEHSDSHRPLYVW